MAIKGQRISNPLTRRLLHADDVETPPSGFYAEFYNLDMTGYPLCRKDENDNVLTTTARLWEIEAQKFSILSETYPPDDHQGEYAYVVENEWILPSLKRKGFYLATPSGWEYQGNSLDDGSIGLHPVDDTGLTDRSVPIFNFIKDKWETSNFIVTDLETPATITDRNIPSVKLMQDQFDALSLSGFVYITDVTPTISGKAVFDKSYLPDTVPANKVLTACSTDSLNIRVAFECEGGEFYTPKININGIDCTNLSRLGDTRRYTGFVDIIILGDSLVTVESDTKQSGSITVTYVAAPAITGITLGAYPGAQTELKAGDNIDITISTNVAIKFVEIDNYEACNTQTFTVTPSKNSTVSVAIADRGNTVADLHIRARVGTAAGSYSEYYQSATVKCNNLHPSFSAGTIQYPSDQKALKGNQSAFVTVVVNNFSTVQYSSGNGQLTIPNPAVYGGTKTVSRLSGDYNVGTSNYTITAFRTANAATAVYNSVVKIANVAPIVTVATPSSRLRSGGNDGTSAQNYTVTISANQNLLSAPSLAAGIGTWQGGGFSGSETSWTRSLQIHDNDNKGSATFSGLSAAGLSGIQQTVISSGASYVVGGFVSRSLTLVAFGTQTEMNVAVKDDTKLLMTWSVKSPMYYSTIGTQPPQSSGWTINATGAKPTTVVILDTQAAGGSSQASTITIEETV